MFLLSVVVVGIGVTVAAAVSFIFLGFHFGPLPLWFSYAVPLRSIERVQWQLIEDVVIDADLQSSRITEVLAVQINIC